MAGYACSMARAFLRSRLTTQWRTRVAGPAIAVGRLGWRNGFHLTQFETQAAQLGDSFQSDRYRLGRHINFHPGYPSNARCRPDPDRFFGTT